MLTRSLSLLLVLHGFAAPAMAESPPRGVEVFAGAGPATLHDGSSRPGTALFAGAESFITSWCAFGGEAAVMDFGSPQGGSFIPEDIVTYDRTSAMSLTGLVRIETPVRTGPSLFLVSQTGAAYVRWGDLHVYSMFSPPPGTYVFEGPKELVWCSVIGAGVRLRLRHPAPSFEGSVQFLSLTGSRPGTVASPRLSVIY